MSEHTALPWRVGDAGTTVFGPPNGNPSPVTVAHTTCANAAYIVQACNSHEAVTAALRVALAIISKDIDMHDEDIEQIYAALAQAEEKQ